MNAGPVSVTATAIEPVDQPLLYQHCRIEMPGGRVIGEDLLRLVRFQGQENVSDLFEYQLELHGNSDAEGASIVLSEVIGRPITVGIARTEFEDRAVSHQAFLRTLDGADPDGPYSVFHGMVAAFALAEPGVYRITMRPAAWRMSFINHYRILGQKNLRDALAQLCREHRVDAVFDGLSGHDNLANVRVQDWLQAGETDLEFMRRLMSKAHVYYYFRHYPDRHVMVFDNRPVYPPSLPDDAVLRYTWTGADELGLHQSDTLTQYSYQQAIGVTGVEGVFTGQREAWDVAQPNQPLASFASFHGNSGPDLGDLPFTQYKIVQYGFSDGQVRAFAQATGQAMRASDLQLSGSSLCPSLRVGHRFRMRSDRPEVRPELDNLEFVLTHVQHDSSLDGEYSNQFSATVVDALITPVGVQDTQQGLVLAQVVTPSGDGTIHDWPYYVPDDFSLARQTMEDSDAVQPRLNAKGVHVRFSCDDPDAPPVWVKLAAHMQTIPEVGTNVWVSRANDESELPEIQNIVQADGSKVVVDSGWTAHTQVGNSFSTSYGDSRSIRFGQPWSRADVAVAVKLVEDAYARGLFRDASYSRGGGYNYSTSEQAEQGLLSESWSYGSSLGNSWGKETKNFSATGRTYHESVTGKYDTSLASTEADDPEALAAVQASRSVVWGDSYSNSTSHGDTKAISVYHGTFENDTTHDGDVVTTTTVQGTSSNTSTHHGTVSSKNDIFADSDSESTITGISSNRSTHNIVLNTSTITQQTSSTTIGSNISSDVIGKSDSTSSTGHSSRTALTGVSTEVSRQGMSNTVGVTGMDTRVSMTGVSNTVTVTGLSNTVSVVGLSTSVEVAGPGLHLEAKAEQFKFDLNGPVMQIPVIILVL